MSSLRAKTSVRKGGTKYTTKPPSGFPEFEMLAPTGKSNGFVVQITEGRPSISEPDHSDEKQQHDGRQRARSKPQPPPLTIPPKARIAQEQKPQRSPSPPAPSPVQDRAPSAAGVPLPRSNAPTPTPADGGIISSPNAKTPVMRSMFPEYDPSRPLARQSYYPDLDAVPGLASAMAVAGSSSINRTSNNPYRQQMARRSLEISRSIQENQRPAVAEVKESPLHAAESTEQQATYSNPEQLEAIWGISNGQAASDGLAETYSLELSW